MEYQYQLSLKSREKPRMLAFRFKILQQQNVSAFISGDQHKCGVEKEAKHACICYSIYFNKEFVYALVSGTSLHKGFTACRTAY